MFRKRPSIEFIRISTQRDLDCFLAWYKEQEARQGPSRLRRAFNAVIKLFKQI